MKLIKNSVVLLCENHNPSLLTDTFLKKAGIISKDNNIIPNSYILTPALSTIKINNKDNITTTITLDPNTMKIEGSGKQPVEFAHSYCENLPNIVGRAYGINFIVHLPMSDYIEWFNSHKISKYKDIEIVKVGYSFNVPNGVANINLEKKLEKKNVLQVQFNFHYELNKRTIGEIDKLFEKYEKNYIIVQDFIENLTK